MGGGGGWGVQCGGGGSWAGAPPARRGGGLWKPGAEGAGFFSVKTHRTLRVIGWVRPPEGTPPWGVKVAGWPKNFE